MSRPGPKPTVTAEARAELLEALKAGLSLREALVVAGLSKSAVRRAAAADKEFGARLKKAGLSGKLYHCKSVYRRGKG